MNPRLSKSQSWSCFARLRPELSFVRCLILLLKEMPQLAWGDAAYGVLI